MPSFHLNNIKPVAQLKQQKKSNIHILADQVVAQWAVISFFYRYNEMIRYYRLHFYICVYLTLLWSAITRAEEEFEDFFVLPNNTSVPIGNTSPEDDTAMKVYVFNHRCVNCPGFLIRAKEITKYS